MDHTLLLLGHLLCFVFWLGADVAVYYTSGFVVDPKQPPAARVLAARVMLAIDMLPRSCLILMLPFGLMLAARAGWLALPAWGVAAIWFGSLAWLGLAHAVFRLERTPLGHTLHRVDVALRVAVLVALVLIAASGLLFERSLVQNAPWLIAKLALFALIIACGLAIRVLLAPFGALFGRVAAGQSDAANENALRGVIARVKPAVWLIWIALLASAWFGLAKPYW